MRVHKLFELADLLARDILEYAAEHKMDYHDLLVMLAIAERFIHEVAGEDQEIVHRAMQEAEATFTAMSTELELN